MRERDGNVRPGGTGRYISPLLLDPAPSLQIGENLTESSVEFKPLSVADIKY